MKNLLLFQRACQSATGQKTLKPRSRLKLVGILYKSRMPYRSTFLKEMGTCLFSRANGFCPLQGEMAFRKRVGFVYVRVKSFAQQKTFLRRWSGVSGAGT
jgi:hypothetical protein